MNTQHNDGGVGLFRASLGCSRRWSQPRGTSLHQSLAPLQGLSDGHMAFPIFVIEMYLSGIKIYICATHGNFIFILPRQLTI